MTNRTVLLRLPFACALLLATCAFADEPPLPGQLQVMRGHTETVYAVSFSPDAKFFATGGFDKSVRLWDPTTGKEIRSYAGKDGHQNLVLAVAFSGDGSSLASGGSDNFAKVWDIPVSTPLKEYAQTGGVTSVSVTPDGKVVAAAATDGTVKLFSTVDGKQLFNLAGHAGAVNSVQFSANGQILASAGADGTVRYWNPTTGAPITTVGAHPSPVNGLAIHPNNAIAYTVGEDGTLKFWTLPAPASRPIPPHTDAINALHLSNDGNQVLTGSTDKNVRLSTFANGAPIRDFAGSPSAVQVVAIAPNNANVAAGTIDGRVLFWKTADGKLDVNVPVHAGPITGLTYRQDAVQLATAGADGKIKLWTTPSLPQKAFPSPDRVLSVSVRPDATKFITGGADKIVRLIKTADGVLERQFPGHTAEVTSVASTPDGATILSGSNDESIRFWNSANGQQIGAVIGHVGPVTSLVMSPQGANFASTGVDGTVKFWQLPFVAPKVLAHPDAVLSLTVSNDGNRFLTIGNDKQARLWNVANPQPERAYTANNQPITAVAIAPDNVSVAIAGADKSLSVWNAGTEVKKFVPLPAVVQAVAFSPDSKQLAVGLADNSVRLLTIADAKELKKLDGHTAPVASIAYSPKGDLILSASPDKSVKLWNAADGVAKGQIVATNPITTIAISKDSLRVALSGPSKNVELFTLADQKVIGAPIVTPADVKGLSFSPDGLRLAVAGADNKVRVFGADGKLQEAFAHDAPATGVAFLPDGKRIVSTSADKTLKISTSAFIAQGFHAGPVRQVLISPQSDRLFSVSDDKTFRILEAKTGKELKSTPAHDAPIVAIATSADASKVVTASADKSAKVWAVADGKLLATVPLAGPATAVAMSPNGLRIAVAYTEGAVNKVKAFDAVSGAELMSLNDSPTVVRSLVFLPDNRTLMSTGDDKVVSLTDIAVQLVLPGHVGGVTSLNYNVSGGQLLTTGNDKFVRLWDLAQNKELKAFGPFPEATTASNFSRDGALIAYAIGKTVKVINPTDGKELATLVHPGAVVSISFNNDKTKLVTGTTDNLARVWDIPLSKELQSFSHGGAVKVAVFHPNTTNIVTASADKTAAVHTISVQRVVPASTMPLRSVLITPNQTHVVTGGDDKAVKGWNAGNGVAEKDMPGATAPVYAVAISKNVQTFAAAGADKKIRVYTFADGKQVGEIPASGTVLSLAFHANNNILAAACDDKTVTAYNVGFVPGQPMPPEFGTRIQGFAHADKARSVTFVENGPLYSGGDDKFAKSWKLASDVPTQNFQHPNLVDSVSFDAKGDFLATGCHDGIVRIYDLPKKALLKQINAHITPTPQPIYSVLWSNDGKQLLSCSYDASMKLWDVASGNLVREFKKYDEKAFPKGHSEAIFSAAFSPDGQFIASGSSDRTLKLWKVADATVVRDFANSQLKQSPPPVPPTAHPGWVYGVRFSPDGQTLITTGSAPRNQGYIAVWRVADGQMLSGAEIASGPIYGLTLDKEGNRMGIACGPKNRLQPTGEAVILKVPGK